MDVDRLCGALNNLRNYENFEYEDEKHIIENLINLIAEDKLPLDSINFRKICTQVRLFTPPEKVQYIDKTGQKITFSFPEVDLQISPKEYDYYSNYKDKEDVIRMILGITENKEKRMIKADQTHNSVSHTNEREMDPNYALFNQNNLRNNAISEMNPNNYRFNNGYLKSDMNPSNNNVKKSMFDLFNSKNM